MNQREEPILFQREGPPPYPVPPQIHRLIKKSPRWRRGEVTSRDRNDAPRRRPLQPGSAIVHVREPRLAERGLETEDGYEQRLVAPKGALAEPWRRIGPLAADGADCFGRGRGPDNRNPRRWDRPRPRHRNPWDATPRAPARHAPSAACKATRDRARSNRACWGSACAEAAVTTGASVPADRRSAGRREIAQQLLASAFAGSNPRTDSGPKRANLFAGLGSAREGQDNRRLIGPREKA